MATGTHRAIRRFRAAFAALVAAALTALPSSWGQAPSSPSSWAQAPSAAPAPRVMAGPTSRRPFSWGDGVAVGDRVACDAPWDAGFPGHGHPSWGEPEPSHWPDAEAGGWYERFDGAAAARHWDTAMREAGRGPGRFRAGEPGSVPIPEPLLFDLVRPLGPRQGEVEFNTLAIFPWRARNRDLTDDPFGPGPSTPDRRDIEWAPEVEWAIVDNFAIEFELPFEGGKLEELKLGLQWTFGTAFDDHYIHGVQVLIEPTPQWRQWNSTLLYLGGIRFDETWSALLMFGGRMDLEGPRNSDSFERLFNASLFADVTEDIVVGVETNFASRIDGRRQFIVVPQTHLEFTERIELQAGVGLGVADSGYELSGIIRGIITN